MATAGRGRGKPRALLGYDTTGDGRLDAFDTNQDGAVDIRIVGTGGGGAAGDGGSSFGLGWEGTSSRAEKGVASPPRQMTMTDEERHAKAAAERFNRRVEKARVERRLLSGGSTSPPPANSGESRSTPRPLSPHHKAAYVDDLTNAVLKGAPPRNRQLAPPCLETLLRSSCVLQPGRSSLL